MLTAVWRRAGLLAVKHFWDTIHTCYNPDIGLQRSNGVQPDLLTCVFYCMHFVWSQSK